MRPKQIWIRTVGEIMDDPNTPMYAEQLGMTPFEVEDHLGTMLHILSDTEEKVEMYDLMNQDLTSWSIISNIFKRFDAGHIFRDIEDWAFSF